MSLHIIAFQISPAFTYGSPREQSLSAVPRRRVRDQVSTSPPGVFFRSSTVASRTPVNPICVKIDTASLQRAASSLTTASQRNWSSSFQTAGELDLHNEVLVSLDKCVRNQTVPTVPKHIMTHILCPLWVWFYQVHGTISKLPRSKMPWDFTPVLLWVKKKKTSCDNAT